MKKPIPQFNSEVEERAFWAAHDSTDYLDWRAAESVSLPKLGATSTDAPIDSHDDVPSEGERGWTTAKPWGVSALTDQQLGAIGMSVEQAAILFVACFIAFGRMLDEEGDLSLE